MYKTKFPFALFAIFLYSSLAFTQNSIVQKTDSTGYYKLSDVVITATKTPKSTMEIANSISIVDSVQIANSNASNVFDLLKNEPGVNFTQLGGNGTLSNISIRGADNSHTLVLIDGVEVNLANDPKGVYDFSVLPVDNIERIEVLRGPQSTLYGSDALGGLINIITKKGNGSPKFSLLTEAGSYNTYKAQLGLNGAINKLNYSITFGRKSSEGFSVAAEKYGNTEKDGYSFNNISSLIGYNISDNAEINLYTRFVKSESDNDQFGGMFGDDPTYITKQDEFSIRAEGKIKSFDGLWNQKIGVSFLRNVRKNSFDTSSASIFYSNAIYDGRRYKLDWQNDLKLGSLNLITSGTDFEFDRSTFQSYYLNYLGLDNFINVSPMKEMRTIGLYLQDQLKIDNSLFVTLGVRSDYNNKFGSNFTYRISPAFMLWETGTKIKANIGTGFKAPTLYNLFDPIYGNSDLKPEQSFGWDFGIEQFLFSQNISIGAEFFYNKFEDMITVDYTQLKSININKAITKGGEFFAQANPFSELNIKLNYTLMETRDVSTNSVYYGTKLFRRPANKAGLTVSYLFNTEANINAEIIWVGNRDDLDFSNFPAKRIELKGYLLTNLAAHYDLLKFLRLNIRIENLFDTEYEDVFGYGTAGLSFYGGVKLMID